MNGRGDIFNWVFISIPSLLSQETNLWNISLAVKLNLKYSLFFFNSFVIVSFSHFIIFIFIIIQTNVVVVYLFVHVLFPLNVFLYSF